MAVADVSITLAGYPTRLVARRKPGVFASVRHDR